MAAWLDRRTLIDAADILTDGGFNNWNTDTDLTSWNEGTTGGTVNRNSASAYEGANCVRISKTSAAQVNVNQARTTLIPGKWYLATVYVFQSPAATSNPNFMIVNTTDGGIYLQEDGSWSTTQYLFDLPAVDSWTKWTQWFQIPGYVSAGAQHNFHYRQDDDDTGSYYFDAASIMGPYNDPNQLNVEFVPNMNDYTRAEVIIDGDNIMGPCIIDWISVNGGSGTGDFQLWDATAVYGRNVQFFSFDSASPPYGHYDLSPFYCHWGLWAQLPSGLLCSVGYR